MTHNRTTADSIHKKMTTKEGLRFHFPRALLDKAELFYTPTGRLRREQRLLKFYIRLSFYTYYGVGELKRHLKKRICKELKIKKSAFWNHLKTLERIGLVRVEKLKKPYIPPSLPNQKTRRAVCKHRFILNAVFHSSFIRVPLEWEVTQPEFDILKLIENCYYAQSHPKAKKPLPDRAKTTRHRMAKRHAIFIKKAQKRALLSVPYRGRDISNKLDIYKNNTIQRGSEVKKITLIEVRTRNMQQLTTIVPAYMAKRVFAKGRLYRAFKGKLYVTTETPGVFKYYPRAPRAPEFFVPNAGQAPQSMATRAELLEGNQARRDKWDNLSAF